jgi:hypothetical protein
MGLGDLCAPSAQFSAMFSTLASLTAAFANWLCTTKALDCT